MPMIEAAFPFIRPTCLYESAPSSIRATSPSRTEEPSGLRRTTIFANCSGVRSLPWDLTAYVNSCPFGAGSAPTWPAGFTVLCCWTARERSLTVRPSFASWSGWIQIRIAYSDAPKLDLPDAVDAVERVVDVDERVVPEEQAVIRALGRIERNEHERRALRLAVGEPELVHLDGNAGQGLRDAVLGVDLVGVAVGADLERDPDGDRTVVRVHGLEVQHVLDAVHLLLDRRRDGLLDCQRVGARIGGLDLDERRDDVGELRDGEPEHGDESPEDRHDRDDDRDDGPVYEEAGHGVTSPRPR